MKRVEAQWIQSLVKAYGEATKELSQVQMALSIAVGQEALQGPLGEVTFLTTLREKEFKAHQRVHETWHSVTTHLFEHVDN